MRRETSYGDIVFVTSDKFQSTPFVRRETLRQEQGRYVRSYFNPLPSWEGRPDGTLLPIAWTHFNPLPSWEGRRARARHCRKTVYISIHSLREKGDPQGLPTTLDIRISIHSLREKGDVIIHILPFSSRVFQSTPFVRRETFTLVSIFCQRQYFNPLPSWEGRLWGNAHTGA